MRPAVALLGLSLCAQVTLPQFRGVLAGSDPVYDYYVDAVGGNDGNAGTKALPVKTLAQVMVKLATLPTNFLINSSDFSQWANLATPVTIDTIVAPDGSATADVLSEGNTSNYHQRYTAFTTVVGHTYTFSIYMKHHNHQWVQLRNDKNPSYSAFDLQNGVVGAKGSTITTQTIIACDSSPCGLPSVIGTGWYRLALTWTAASSSSTATVIIELAASNTTTPETYLGANTDLYAWGAMVNEGATASSYIATTTQVVTDAGGFRVGLKAGNAWHESFWPTTPTNNLVIGRYGAGATPLITAVDPIMAGAWSLHAAQTYTYDAPITHELGPSKTFIGAWENGSHLIWKTSIADVEATPGSYTLSDTTTSPPSPVTLSIHPLDNSNPGTNGFLYEYTARQHAVYAGAASRWTISNIRTRGNLHRDGVLLLPFYATLRNVTAEDGSYHSVFVGPGSSLYSVVASGSYDPSGGNPFIWNPAGAGENMLYDSCVCDIPVSAGSGSFGCFGGHGTGLMGTITFRNNKTYNAEQPYGAEMFVAVSMTNNESHGTGLNYAIDAPDATSITINGFIAESANIHALTSAAAATISLSNWNIVGAGNLYTASGTTSLTITDSSLNGMTPVAYTGAGAFSSLTFLRNSVPSAAGYIFFLPSLPTSFASDYNATVSGQHISVGGAAYTWTQWKALGVQDQHSTP